MVMLHTKMQAWVTSRTWNESSTIATVITPYEQVFV